MNIVVDLVIWTLQTVLALLLIVFVYALVRAGLDDGRDGP